MVGVWTLSRPSSSLTVGCVSLKAHVTDCGGWEKFDNSKFVSGCATVEHKSKSNEWGVQRIGVGAHHAALWAITVAWVLNMACALGSVCAVLPHTEGY